MVWLTLLGIYATGVLMSSGWLIWQGRDNPALVLRDWKRWVSSFGWPYGVFNACAAYLAVLIIAKGYEYDLWGDDALESCKRILLGIFDPVEHVEVDVDSSDCAEALRAIFKQERDYDLEVREIPNGCCGTIYRLTWHQQGSDSRPFVNGFIQGWKKGFMCGWDGRETVEHFVSAAPNPTDFYVPPGRSE